MKTYLPAFDLTATVPSVEAAASIQQGMLELLQYRGNCIQHFDDIETKSPESHNKDIKFQSIVGVATKQQIFASILHEMPWKDLIEAIDADPSVYEKWEVEYARASALFCQFKFEECTAHCVKNLEQTPSDIFTLRLLFISAYFCSDTHIVAEQCLKMAHHYKNVVMVNNKEDVNKNDAPSCVYVSLPLVQAWAAYGLEETGQPTEKSLILANEALDNTRKLNKKLIEEKEKEEDASWYKSSDEAVSDVLLSAAIKGSAIEGNFTNVFAIHAVCHIWESEYNPQKGIDWLLNEENRNLWVPAIHLAPHVWWHLALFYFAAGQISEALEIYQMYLGNVTKDSDPFTLSDATALIVRVALMDDMMTSSSSSPFLIKNEDDKAIVTKASAYLDSLWDTFDASTKSKDTSIVPFFHVHKCLMKFVVSVCGNDRKDETKKFNGKVISESFTKLLSSTTDSNGVALSSSYSTKHKLFNILMANLLQFSSSSSDFNSFVETAITSSYLLANIEAFGKFRGIEEVTLDGSELHDNTARHMGGSIAQRHLMFFVWLWIVQRIGDVNKNDEDEDEDVLTAVLVKNTITTKVHQDAESYGRINLMLKSFGEMF